jgi:hypothetical protein
MNAFAPTIKNRNAGRTFCVLCTINKIEKNRSITERFFLCLSIFIFTFENRNSTKKILRNGKLGRRNQFENR